MKLLLLLLLLALCASAVSAGSLYSNDFAVRTSSGATPSGRWMEAAYVPGALARPVFSISSEGREPYNYATEYQDGWTMKTGYCRESVLFTVADDGDNQGALVNAKSRTTSYQSATIAMQPFYNEFTNGSLRISVDIRTPSTASSFSPSANACATLAPFYRSALDVTSSSFAAPMHFGPANLADGGGAWRLCAVTRGKADANAPGSYFGLNDSRTGLSAGSWVRYVAVLDLDAGTYTATFARLGTDHPTPDTTGASPEAFRRSEDDETSTTFALLDPPTEKTGGVAGLAFYVQGIKEATSAADAPMYDNVAVSWKAPGAMNYVAVYENDFSTRRYRQVEPAGTTSGAYVPVATTNVVQSSFYDRWQGSTDYGVSDSNTSARRLVPDGAPYLGLDGWRRIAGKAYFKMVDPNKSGYGWDNASVLRATGSGRTGMVAAPLGTTVASGKVRLYCDILMGAITNSTSQTRDIGAAAFLAGDGAFTNAWYDAAVIRADGIAAALRGRGVCGAGTCFANREPGSAMQTSAPLYRFDGSAYSAQPSADGGGARIGCGRWGRFVVTLDLDAGTYDLAVYDLGYDGQSMDYDHTAGTRLAVTNGLALAASAVRTVDSVVLFSDGQSNYNGGSDVIELSTGERSKNLGRFPLFDNVRVCLVDADGADGTELYACDFEYGYRLSVRDEAPLAGPTDREGADRWIRRGNNFGTIGAVDAGGVDGAVVLDGLGYVMNGSSGITREGYAVQPFGATTKGCDVVDLAADIRPPACFVRSSGCFVYVEVGGDAYAQGVHRPAGKSSWRYEPRIGFGFSVGAGYNDVRQYTNVVLAVQAVASKGATAATATSGCAIDRSHWYRFRAKADQQADKFTVRVYDQGAAKPAAGDADGTLVATFENLDLPAFGDEGMTTFGLAGAGFCGFSGGGVDDPNVALVDNLSASGSVTFASFLEEYGLPPDTAPETVTNGIPAAVRYVFDIDPAIGPADLPEPLIDVTFDADGAPGVKLPEQKNTEGATVTVLATEDLSNWSQAELVEMRYDPSDGTWKSADGIDRSAMFFKWRIDIDDGN